MTRSEDHSGVTTRRNALKAVAGVVAGVSIGGSASLAAEKTKCAELFDRYLEAKAARDAASRAHDVAYDHFLSLMPEVPEELVQPNPKLSFWAQSIATWAVIEPRAAEAPLRLYYRQEALENFITNPPPSASHPFHVAADAVKYARELLPVSVQYEQGRRAAEDASRTDELYAELEAAMDRLDDARDKVMRQPAQSFADFGLKARAIRSILDLGLEADRETEDLVDQLIEWSAANGTA